MSYQDSSAASVFQKVFGHPYDSSLFKGTSLVKPDPDHAKQTFSYPELLEYVDEAKKQVYQSVMDSMHITFQQSQERINYFRDLYESAEENRSRLERECLALDKADQAMKIEIDDLNKKNQDLDKKRRAGVWELQTKLYVANQKQLELEEANAILEDACKAGKAQIDQLKTELRDANKDARKVGQFIDEMHRRATNMSLLVSILESVTTAGPAPARPVAQVDKANVPAGVPVALQTEPVSLDLQLNAQIDEIRNELLTAQRGFQEEIADVKGALAAETARFEAQLAAETARFEAQLAAEKARFETQLAAEKARFETQLAAETAHYESQLAAETQLATERQLAAEAQLAAETAHYKSQLAAETAHYKSQLAAETERRTRESSELRARLDAETARADRAERMNQSELKRFESEKEQFQGVRRHLEEKNKELRAKILQVKSAFKKEWEKAIQDFGASWFEKTEYISRECDILTVKCRALNAKSVSLLEMQEELETTKQALADAHDEIKDMQLYCTTLDNEDDADERAAGNGKRAAGNAEPDPRLVVELHAAQLAVKELSARVDTLTRENEAIRLTNGELEEENREAKRMFHSLPDSKKELVLQNATLRQDMQVTEMKLLQLGTTVVRLHQANEALNAQLLQRSQAVSGGQILRMMVDDEDEPLLPKPRPGKQAGPR